MHAHHGNVADGPGYQFLVTAWSIEATGGQRCYLGRDTIATHDSLSIDRAGFDAVAREISATLMFLGVPALGRDEFNAIIESYRGQVVQAGAVQLQPPPREYEPRALRRIQRAERQHPTGT